MNTIKIMGMSCQGCVKHIVKALEALPGATNVSVDFVSGTAQVDGVSSEAALAAVEEAGYQGKVQ